MTQNKKLDNNKINWAYKKWCSGYSLEEIAKALDISVSYLSTTFNILNLKKCRPSLHYSKYDVEY